MATKSKREKCLDADRVLNRLKEDEEKIRELTENQIAVHAQMEDLTNKTLAMDAKINSNNNIFDRIRQRLGLWYVTFKGLY